MKQKKKQKEAEKKAAAAAATGTAEPEAADVGDGTAEQADQGGEDDDNNFDDVVDFATDSYKEHYDAMEELD